MVIRVAGMYKNKKYKSKKKFENDEAALKFAYSKVYKKCGNKKRKNQLSNIELLKI